MILSDVVVDTILPAYTWNDFFAHQLRWARSVRDVRRWGYLGVLLTFGLPWAMLAVIACWGSPWMPVLWMLLGTAGLIRLMVAMAVGVGILRDPQVLRNLWLVPLRDLIAMAIWCASFAGNTIVWRGMQFRLKDGKLSRI